MNILFFVVLGLYFLAVILQFSGTAFKKDTLTKGAWWLFVIAFALQTLFLVLRGAIAHRLPLSNQFEFANAFAWGIALLLIVVRGKLHAEWLSVAAMPAALLVLSYAALQPKEITELMPALRSAWFGIHIGSAVFSYASFILAGCVGLRYVLMQKKGGAEKKRLAQMDYLIYRLVGFGFLFLTIVILSGAIWAEQAWSAFWTWDPKETWALITWLIYAAYLHLRLQKKWQGKRMAVFSVAGIVCVLFTFIGVNVLFNGLHSYK